MTLTDFLLARITEDEEDGGEAEWDGGMCQTNTGTHYTNERVLAECDAKRQILALTQHGCGDDYERVQKALALPYADHPDYNASWAV